MSSIKPMFFNRILDKLYHKDTCNIENCKLLAKSYRSIQNQCENADPIFQDYRYGIICDTLDEFKHRKINKINLIYWKILISAIFPWDKEYSILRQNVNRRFVLFPWVIAMCKTDNQVLKAFDIALKYNIPFCIRSGAHCYEPYSLCDGMIIDQSKRDLIKLDIDKKLVKIESGCLNGPTAFELSKHKVAFPAGTCANVGITGLCLNGGMGFLGRKYGLTCDNLVELEIIISNGKKIVANNYVNSELFWACRGAGGGNFGIVTSLTLQVYPIDRVVIVEFFWPKEFLSQVLKTWLIWGPTSDVNLTTEFNVLSMKHNALPVMITGLFIGNNLETLNHILEPLLKLNPSKKNSWETSYIDSVRHYTYQKFPAPFFKNKSTYVMDILPDEISDIIIKYMSRADANDRLEFDGLGGAYTLTHNSCYPHRQAKAWVQWIVRWGANVDNNSTNAWEDFTKGPEKIAWLNSFYKEFMESGKNVLQGAYYNCPESELEDWPIKYFGNNLTKLIEIKKKYDINKIFKFPQGLSELY